MAAHPKQPNPRRRHHMMAAVVLGTALTTVGISPAQARQSSDVEAKFVQDISKYCTVCWRNARLPADCWSDCTQEVLSRLVQQLPLASWNRVFRAEGEERKEFVRAIDAVKKRTQRRLKRDKNLGAVPVDHRVQSDRRRADDRDSVRQAARAVLSDRQQRILQMSFEGWSVQDIAGELDLAAERVSDEKYKAICKLRRHLGIDKS